MTVFLIRHGRTLANEQHLYCGSTDLPLSRAGRKALANRPPIDVGAARFITSGMRRCNETLAILFGNVPYEVVRDFREIDFGAFEMKSYEMLKDEPAYQTWLSRDPEINPPPGGESGEQMTRRVLAAYKALESRKENTVIVTHGGVIMSMLSQRALPSRHPEQWMADPGCGYTVQTDVQLWMRDRLVEAIDIVPFGYADTLRGQAETEENEAYE